MRPIRPHKGSPGGLTRRNFLSLVAASMASAPACRRAINQQIVPYVRRPSAVTPGATTTYATAMILDGFATGLLVSCREGRPIKVEGNPEHPASLGAAGPIEQASVLQLYDPDRLSEPSLRGVAASWTGVRQVLTDLRRNRGEGVCILMPPTSSPLLGDLMTRLVQVCPAVRFAFHSSARSDNGRAGAHLLYGRDLETVPSFENADTVVSLDADFLSQGPFWLRHARQWAAGRNPDGGRMGRLYCAETMLSVTGSMAEHRLAVPPLAIAQVALRLAGEIVARLPGVSISSKLAALLSKWRAHEDAWLRGAAHDLTDAPGRGVIVVGDRHPPALHALAHLLNRLLGNQGRTVNHIAPALVQAPQTIDLPALATEIHAGRVKALLVLEGNPSYTAPVELDFRRLINRVPLRLYLGEFENETAVDCQWLVPAAHYLESWGDARAFDGTVSLLQPVIAGLHDAHTPADVLTALIEQEPAPAREVLKRYWRTRQGQGDFATFWEEALMRGLIPGTAEVPIDVLAADETALARELDRLAGPPAGYQINFLPDPGVYDGKFSNNAWLQEFPRPITKLCWSNAALVSPGLARDLRVEDGDVVELSLGGRSLQTPVLVLPGHAEGAVTLHLGFGRNGAERLATHVGVDAGLLRTRAQWQFGAGLGVRRTGQHRELALRQLHQDMHDRPIALQAGWDDYRRHPDQFAQHRGPLYSLMRPYDYVGEQWAMSIDLGLCIGCGSCVVACQAENNVPVVGADQVRRGRIMQWMRVDTYLTGSGSSMRVIHQPLPCQHCEDAPCEYVCPVNATVHSVDGLNEMVYNRCVGTRFCSNNCPYKVRRFNWYNWHNREIANRGSVRAQRNPEVTVRERGVMEKCTYCVQRIRRAQIEARIEDRSIRPGEVQTACQQACPTGAIAFASLSHQDTPAVRRRRLARAYELLHDQGTRPRTWYLARIDNPNPDLSST